MATYRHSITVTSAINSLLIDSLKEHYLKISKMPSSPRVISPSTFSIIKGALDGSGPVVTRNYDEEEVSVSVMPLTNIVLGGGGDDGINQDLVEKMQDVLHNYIVE